MSPTQSSCLHISFSTAEDAYRLTVPRPSGITGSSALLYLSSAAPAEDPAFDFCKRSGSSRARPQGRNTREKDVHGKNIETEA